MSWFESKLSETELNRIKMSRTHVCRLIDEVLDKVDELAVYSWQGSVSSRKAIFPHRDVAINRQQYRHRSQGFHSGPG